jgi:hypothetical protein
MELNTTSECRHESVADRALTATWVLDEIRLAVQKGYKVIKIYEVYEYRITQYTPQTRLGGLFAEYIDTFLKLKAEASGYPDWVRSSDDENRYIREFSVSEVIQLYKDCIQRNAARRALAKLCLNLMWGKLTERNNRTRTKMITDHKNKKFLVTPGIDVTSLFFANDQVVWVSWKYIEEEKIPCLKHTNEVIRAYVTAGARIHLYKYLDTLQERASTVIQIRLYISKIMTNSPGSRVGID